MIKKGLLSIVWQLILLAAIQAQFPGAGGSSGSPMPQVELEPDTFDFNYFYPENPGLLYEFSDTLLDNSFNQYDPVRQRDVDYLNLGSPGTAHLAQNYESRFHRGIDLGFHQYDLYKINPAKLRFDDLRKPFSDLYFSQGPSQQDTYFKAKFSRDFAKGLNFSIDYQRFNDLGVFKSQRSFHTFLSTGFWYSHKNGKYDAFITYTSNTIDQEDNGGVDRSELMELNTEAEFNFPIYINETAATRHISRQYQLTHHYRLNNAKDSTRSVDNQRAYVITHQLELQNGSYKFYDSSPESDSSYYQNLQIDNRGLRYFWDHNYVENSFWLSTSKSGEADGKINQRDFLKVGLTHTFHAVDQEPLDSNLQNLYLRGQWNFSPNERLDVKTYAHLGLLANAGDYRLSGDLFFDFKKAGQLKIQAIQQGYSPTLLQSQMYISQQLLWRNDFAKTIETSLGLTYQLPRLNDFSISGRYQLINNFIYHDTDAFPKQTGIPLSVLQLLIKPNFRLGPIHLDNTILLQTVTEDFLRLPSFFTKHSLYFEGRIFKRVMLARFGFDLRLREEYFVDTYQPLIGQFHLQDQQSVKFYPALDAFLSFKVKSFRFLLRASNLTRFVRDDLYYQVAGYPQPYFFLRFGVSWQLLN